MDWKNAQRQERTAGSPIGLRRGLSERWYARRGRADSPISAPLFASPRRGEALGLAQNAWAGAKGALPGAAGLAAPDIYIDGEIE